MKMPRISRHNIDELLDKGLIQVAMMSGGWWTIRRNGQTKRWKYNTSRIRIPVKYGLNRYSQITETDFLPNGQLDPKFFRLNPEYYRD